MSTELSRLRAEFTAELATIRQKDEVQKLPQQQNQNQNQNRQVQQNIHHHPRNHHQQQTLHHSLPSHHHHLHRDSYLTALQKRNRALPIWSVNYFALHRALQRKSGLARFVDCSGKSQFVRLYAEGVARYEEEVREKKEREERGGGGSVVAECAGCCEVKGGDGR